MFAPFKVSYLFFQQFCSESAVIDKDDKSLTKPFVEYIDGARLYLEGESDRDLPTLQDIRLHFSTFVRYLICNTPGTSLSQIVNLSLCYLYPCKSNVFFFFFFFFFFWGGGGGYTGISLPVHFCQSAGGGIKSHLVTALVSFAC